MKRFRSVLMVAIATLLVPGISGASLIGDSVGCSGVGATTSPTCSAPTATVDGGTEFTINLGGPDYWSVDLSAGSIEISGIGILNTVLDSVVVTLDDLDWVGVPDGRIVGFTFETTDLNTSTFDASNISFGDHSISVEIGDGSQNWSIGSDRDPSVRIDLIVEHGGSSSPIPEPGAATLFLLGTLVVGARQEHRRRS